VRIAIVTSGRFHVCDLARELDAKGHDVLFYSLVPLARTSSFGLPERCHRSLGAPLSALQALAQSTSRLQLRAFVNRMVTVALDRHAARVVEACDVFIGMSGLCCASLESIRRRCGARTVLERGSRHILSQKALLEAIPGLAASGVPDWAVSRELKGYALADRIVVPAKHVEASFVERGVPAQKLFRNPYGVDLQMFPPTPAPPRDAPPTIMMVGAWSLRKGCDVLVAAWRRMRTPGTRLLHVGRVLDAPLPSAADFEHHDPVDQRELTAWYERAHVMALASREEGLALVQAQALASGLHLVATDRTGAEDLQECIEDASAVSITPADDVAAFAAALDAQLESARRQRGARDLLGPARQRLTWAAYGARYDSMLRGWLHTPNGDRDAPRHERCAGQAALG